MEYNTNSNDPLVHTAKVKADLSNLANHLRSDIEKLDDPAAKALFEVSAEVLLGLHKAFTDFGQKNEKAWQEGDRNGITVFKNEDISVVITMLEKNAKLEEVQMKAYASLYILKGKINMQAGEDQKQAEAGDLMIFHPCIIYSIEAIEESSFVLTHYYNEEDRGEIF